MYPNLGEPDPKRGKHGWRAPPNYHARSVRIRLFVLVFMVMFVLLAMSKVSDPEFWSFMGFKEKQPATSAEEPVDDEVEKPVDDKVDTRVRDGAKPQRAQDAISVVDETQSDEAAAVPQGGEFDFTVQDGWRHVHSQLEEDQRELLHLILKNARDGSAPTANDLQGWDETLAMLGEGWSQFHTANRKAVAESTDTPDDEKQVWLRALESSEEHWSRHVRPALELAAAGKPLSDAQSPMLDQVQLRLDAVELQQVRDNTHLARLREKNAWFRLFDRLNRAEEEQLIEQSEGRVAFLQLFRQPKRYRGKLVTIRGTARLAYHVQAPSNIYGIKGYYVFWVEPRGMSDQLINVYALETPPNFPEIKDKDLDREKTKLIEPVEFTGYFFKNYNYRTKTGSNIAPLMLAKVPTWEAPDRAPVELPQTSYIVLGILAIAVVAIGISALAYIRSRSTSSMVDGYSVSARAKASQLQQLEKEEVLDIGEQLRQLAESDTNADEVEQAQ